ncbi:MAG: hypothetical protein NTY36_01775 [Deltaproteobacteria bacterium]|nr:hypothetical protein [Deltaproteobacteria bacterium]
MTKDYGASQAYTITPAANYHVADVLVDGTSVGAVTTYKFTNVTAVHTIVASFAIDTNLITASAGATGSITPVGAVPVNYGADQTFTIAATTAHYHVADVLVDGTSVGAVTTYKFTNVTAVHTIVASFAIDTNLITASAGANGSITPVGAVPVNYGADQTFTIAATTAHYHVADVLVDGTSVGAVASYTFSNVTAAHKIEASFAIDTFTITASAGTNGSISPAGAVNVDYNASKTFTITPAAHYHVANVLVDGVSKGTVTSYTFDNVIAAHTIVASFAIDTFTIAASAGAGGSINPSGAKVNYGDSQTFTITHDPGYKVVDVQVDGGSVGAVTSYTFTNVIANHTISATFALNIHTITATAGLGGSISPSGTVPVIDGTSRPFTITPNSGYDIKDVQVDGGSVGKLSSVTFTNVTADHTISATFIAKSIQIVPDRTTLKIPYMKTAKFQVKLSDNPYDKVSVTVAWQNDGGNPNIKILNGANLTVTQDLTFTQDNWNTAQTVTLKSTEEIGTTIIDRATFQLSGDRVTAGTVSVTAFWVENLPSVAPIMELLLDD